jgi:hypothetical protein
MYLKTKSVSSKQVDDRLKDSKDIFATKEDPANTKSDMIKWMFIFWATNWQLFLHSLNILD